MWFKLFILLRMPISGIALLGFAAFKSFGALFALGAYIFLAVVSVQLVRLRPSALSLARQLLALEVFGAVLFFGYGNHKATRQADVGRLFAWACVVVVVWALPNVAALYKARPLFVELAKAKPGL